MYLMVWILVGIVAGCLAKGAVPSNVLIATKGPWGVRGDLIVGVMGAVTGGWLFQNAPGPSHDGWIGNILCAFVTAVFVLFSLRFAVGGQTT